MHRILENCRLSATTRLFWQRIFCEILLKRVGEWKWCRTISPWLFNSYSRFHTRHQSQYNLMVNDIVWWKQDIKFQILLANMSSTPRRSSPWSLPPLEPKRSVISGSSYPSFNSGTGINGSLSDSRTRRFRQNIDGANNLSRGYSTGLQQGNKVHESGSWQCNSNRGYGSCDNCIESRSTDYVQSVSGDYSEYISHTNRNTSIASSDCTNDSLTPQVNNAEFRNRCVSPSFQIVIDKVHDLRIGSRIPHHRIGSPIPQCSLTLDQDVSCVSKTSLYPAITVDKVEEGELHEEHDWDQFQIIHFCHQEYAVFQITLMLVRYPSFQGPSRRWQQADQYLNLVGHSVDTDLNQVVKLSKMKL